MIVRKDRVKIKFSLGINCIKSNKYFCMKTSNSYYCLYICIKVLLNVGSPK